VIARVMVHADASDQLIITIPAGDIFEDHLLREPAAGIDAWDRQLLTRGLDRVGPWRPMVGGFRCRVVPLVLKRMHDRDEG
jgi:hypothetical protein